MPRPWTTPLLLHAAFILLSGASSEPHRCYWCGPLAEQVHRSRRSAPCGASDHVTVCEPGYDYCAVVATSPPRVESRYCVKMYQDECYPLFCNSTKTWKMTCPCRGDLCNGPNTERENEAFALLPKLVAKTHNARIKKRTAAATPHFIKYDSKNKIIANGDAEIHNMANISSDKINNLTDDKRFIVTENESNLDQKSGNMITAQPTNQPVEPHKEDDHQSTVTNSDNIQTQSAINNQLIEIVIHVSHPTKKSMNENEQLCTDSPTTTQSYEASKNTEPAREESEPIIATTVQSLSNTVSEISIKTTESNNAREREIMKTTENVQQPTTQSKHTGKPYSELPTNNTPLMQKDQPANPMDEMQNDAPLISPTDIVQPMKTSEVIKIYEPPTKDPAKATDGKPTAEALQQDGSPPVSSTPVPVTDKSTEPTTTEATTIPAILTTHEQITKITTTPAPRRKNNAVRMSISYTLLLICLVYL